MYTINATILTLNTWQNTTTMTITKCCGQEPDRKFDLFAEPFKEEVSNQSGLSQLNGVSSFTVLSILAGL